MTNGKIWTEDEDIYLEYFVYQGDSSMAEAAEYLGRSTGAVSARLTYLREKNKSVLYVKRRWTDKEDSFINQHYRHLTDEVIGLRLNRTSQAIKTRRKFLKLSRVQPITKHKKKIIELISKGYYRPEIAKELDINANSLSTFLRMNNIYCPVVPYAERTRRIKEFESRCISNVRKRNY